jgi:hypothetical protein
MTFKQFEKWCEERACDGCWGYTEATLCIEVMNLINDYPFWKRKKVWNDFHDRVVNQIVEPTNRKIQELRGDGQ